MRNLLLAVFTSFVALSGFASTAHSEATIDLLFFGIPEIVDPSPGDTITLQVWLTAGPSGSAGAAVTVDYFDAVGRLRVQGFTSNPSGGPELPLVFGETTDTGTEIRNVNAAALPPFVGPGLAPGQSYLLGTIDFLVLSCPAGTSEIRTTITGDDVIVDLAGADITATSTFNSALLICTTPAPELSATKSDQLSDDVDGDGEADPGDTLHYTVLIENLGSADAQNVVFSDTPDTNAPLVSGSVTPTQGVVSEGNGGGDSNVEVDIGVIPVAGSVTVEFDALVGPSSPGVETVSNQGSVSATDHPPVLTDDPDTPVAADPTVTDVLTPLEACQEEAATCDADLGTCESDLGTCDTELGTCETDLMACQTNPPFEDSDGDGEHDDTDACPGTPAGAEVDQAGCSLAEFCAGFDVAGASRKSPCNQADWQNDEPLDAEDCKARKEVCEPR